MDLGEAQVVQTPRWGVSLERTQIMKRKITTHCEEYGRISRRSFLTGGLSGATAFMLGNSLVSLPNWMPRISLADPHVGPRGDTLVVVFLRGGADGMNIVVPHGDEEYYRRRPTIGIARPGDGTDSAVDLDGFFGLHPSLEPLSEIYRAGDLAAVHATGAPDETRSHFEAQDLMERGATEGSDYSGWLARHLTTLDTGNGSALRAIGIGDMLPAALTGSMSGTAMKSIADYHLDGRDDRVGDMQEVLAALYNEKQDLLAAAANQTLASLDIMKGINTNRPPAGRAYPENEFGQAMQTVAHLIHADVGVEVATIDVGGWDTHVAQGGSEGQMANNIGQLGTGLAAFYEDLGTHKDKVSVVVMSEFGRRLQENGGFGTDHGHGNMMMLLGGGINGGQVHARWPGLQEEQLVGPGDLAITTDYRDVLGEVIRVRLNNPLIDQVFPEYTISENNLVVPR